jgi:hypothetical protein
METVKAMLKYWIVLGIPAAVIAIIWLVVLVQAVWLTFNHVR